MPQRRDVISAGKAQRPAGDGEQRIPGAALETARAIGASPHVRDPARTPSMRQVAGSCRLPGCYYFSIAGVSASRADARECGNPGSCCPASSAALPAVSAAPGWPRRQPPEASGARGRSGARAVRRIRCKQASESRSSQQHEFRRLEKSRALLRTHPPGRCSPWTSTARQLAPARTHTLQCKTHADAVLSCQVQHPGYGFSACHHGVRWRLALA